MGDFRHHGPTGGAQPSGRAKLPGAGERRGNRRLAIALAAAAATLALRPVSAEPRAEVQTRCFQFVSQPSRFMELRFVDTEGGNEAAFVHYVGVKDWIPLVLSSTKSIPMGESDRSQNDQEWLEVVHDQIGGRYLISMSGNEVGSFQYVNRKNGAKTDFRLAQLPRGEDACHPR